jgi:hypothetical protein
MLICIEVGDLTSVEDIVDVFKEVLIYDLVVSDQKGDVMAFQSAFHHLTSHVLSEVLDREVLLHLNLKDIVGEDVRGKSCQGLFTTSTNSNEHGVTSRLKKDSDDSADVLNSVIEEDEVHLSLVL